MRHERLQKREEEIELMVDKEGETRREFMSERQGETKRVYGRWRGRDKESLW